MAATGASSSSRSAFSASSRALCSAWVPWEKLKRATFIPAWIISRRTPSLSVEGPRVHTIFVFRISRTPSAISKETPILSHYEVIVFLSHFITNLFL